MPLIVTGSGTDSIIQQVLYHTVSFFRGTNHCEANHLLGIVQDTQHNYSQQHYMVIMQLSTINSIAKVLYHFIGANPLLKMFLEYCFVKKILKSYIYTKYTKFSSMLDVRFGPISHPIFS